MMMQKVLSALLAVVLALGNATCACAAMVSDGDAGSHAHHQENAQTTPDDSDCTHSGCLGDCNSLSAVVPDRDIVLPSLGTIQFDDFDAIESESITYPRQPQSVISTGPPLRRLWRPAETPVRRHDRLLD